MAEILVKAVDASHLNPAKDALCYKRGMPVVVMPDGHPWGTQEGLPTFVVIKIPSVSVATVRKYIAELPAARRRWQIRVAAMPLAARNKLAAEGVLTIKAGSYNGVADYTWAQVKGFFRNLETGFDETEDI